MNFKDFFKFLIQFLSGFDIFISYRWKDAQPYVKILAAELEKKGFTCFIDVKGMTKGDLINEALRRAIRKSTMFVVVVTENIHTSVWIPQELEAFPAHKRKIVPINVDGAIELLQLKNKPWDRLINRNPIQESKANILNGVPAEHVSLEIERAFTAKRQEAVAAGKVFRLALAVAAIVLIMAGFAVYQLTEAKHQQRIAAEMTRDANLQKARADEQTEIAKQQTIIAEQKTVEANQQKEKADKQTEVAEAQTKEANLQRTKAERETQRAIKEQTLAKAQTLALQAERIKWEVSQSNTKVPLQEAIIKYQEALQLFRSVVDINGEINSLRAILSLYGGLTDPNYVANQGKSLKYYEQAERIYSKYRNGFGVTVEEHVDVLRNLGGYYAEKDKLKAIRYYSQLPSLYRQLDSTSSEFDTRLIIARLYESMGVQPQPLTKAREYYQQAIQTYERKRGTGLSPWLAGNVYDHLGDIYLMFNKKKEALDCYKKALEAFSHCYDLEAISCSYSALCMTQKISEFESGRRVSPCNAFKK